jgi:hypothetical protein
MDHASTNGTFDPARRRLCPDGACVGVIGPDGICRECGRTEAAAAAGETAVSMTGEAASEPDQDTRATADPTDGADAGPAGATGAFDSKRRLCDDGSCVGVVGEDGVCRVCGRRSQ